jgi:hypothetical protein
MSPRLPHDMLGRSQPTAVLLYWYSSLITLQYCYSSLITLLYRYSSLITLSQDRSVQSVAVVASKCPSLWSQEAQLWTACHH